MGTPEISVNQAKKDKLFYVVANIIIVNQVDATCLLLRRSDKEKVHPGKWAFPGGKLEHNDVLALLKKYDRKPIEGVTNILGELAMREGGEESGLPLDPKNTSMVSNKVFVRPDGVPVFMATLSTLYIGGEVKLEEDAFSDFAWVTADSIMDHDCIDGIQAEARAALGS